MWPFRRSIRPPLPARQAARLLTAAAFALLISGAAAPAAAQNAEPIAFLNGASQLIISDSLGSTRWIVTNPGEYLALPLGYALSPSGRLVFFAIDAGGTVSLRVGDTTTQTVTEIGQVSPGATGGTWSPDNARVYVAADGQLFAFSATGGGQPLGQAAQLGTPFTQERADVRGGQSVGPTEALVFAAADTTLAVQGTAGTVPLALTGDLSGRDTALWADDVPLVALSGYTPNAALAVANADTGETALLQSDRTAPVTPLAWVADTTTLLYRDLDGVGRAANFSCLLVGCTSDPFAAAVAVLSPTASDVQTTTDHIFYRDNGALYGVQSACIAAGACTGAAVLVGQLAPGTGYSVRGGRIAHTTPESTVVLTDAACIGTGVCAGQALVSGIAGVFSPSGSAITVEGVEIGLAVVDLTTGSVVGLAEWTGGQLLPFARWAG
jgi:DNA-binding beta-propeller fold protein YncE